MAPLGRSVGGGGAVGNEAGGDEGGVEAQAGAGASAEALGAELVGVLVDPAAVHAPPLGDFGRTEQPT